ncbi:hypothetical protein [Thauera aromatica]|uniref:hypothetical protein n=1 Tax=Thauera aromatica TaxID=59405 RepID=UPI001FFDA9A4|nr:hypothetical protein [Thauera aromatica]MCK2095631.1 hypothetical protein [Thauera aromatica]
MSRVPSKAAKVAAAAGGGIPGTNEAAAEARAIEAEAVVEPGGSVAEVLAGGEVLDGVDGEVSHLHVRALPAQGFRRAGRFWPPGEGVTVFADDFSVEQIQALLSEPSLVVTLIARGEAE